MKVAKKKSKQKAEEFEYEMNSTEDLVYFFKFLKISLYIREQTMLHTFIFWTTENLNMILLLKLMLTENVSHFSTCHY